MPMIEHLAMATMASPILAMTGTSTRAHHSQRARVTGWKPSRVSPGEHHPRACPRTRPSVRANDGRPSVRGHGRPVSGDNEPHRSAPGHARLPVRGETPGGTTNGPVVPRTAGPFAVQFPWGGA